MTDIEKDVRDVIGSIREVPNVFARVCGLFDWHTQAYAKNALRRHKNMAGLLDVTDESGIRDDTIREQLQHDVVEDGDFQERLGELEAEFSSALRAASEAVKDFEALCAFWSAEHQRLTQEKSTADVRVAELTERLKEHAKNNTEVREAVWAITGGKCFYCEIELVREVVAAADQVRLFHVDHIVPQSLGGPDHLANYVPACHSCNSSKHAKHFGEFFIMRRAKQEPPLLTVIEGGAA